NTEAVKILLNAGANVNDRDNDGKTPLIHAAGRWNADTVNVLIDAGADVNMKDNDGRKAFDYAVMTAEKRSYVEHSDTFKRLEALTK
ncbi:MAG: ankyrin repeat domain-containing protein, partial [Synergistaceae bacterium]|nr:ankyrin repeat domain-containing protein [Synergistaceae bacterium]